MRTDIHWHKIRTLDGTQDRGFEELCAQLARAEMPNEATFVRKGTPDAGVECYATFGDGTEWCWQAKYFMTSPGDSQWSQVKKSATTALDKHPQMVRYYVCMPLDLADARQEERRSAFDRWQSFVDEFEQRAKRAGRDVEFVFWGSSELIERLSRPEHAGRLQFWFGRLGLDERWLGDRLKVALAAAGPRYTPELNVELPVARVFDIVGRTQRWRDKLRSLAPPLREAVRYLGRHKAASAAPSPSQGLVTAVDAIASAIGGLELSPNGPLSFDPPLTDVEVAQRLARECKSDVMRGQGNLQAHDVRTELYQVHRLIDALADVREALTEDEDLTETNVLLLTGEAGRGKTHLLCDIAERRLSEGRPTVLLMGQRFTDDGDPWAQALQQLDVRSDWARELVGALEAAAEAAGARAFFIVDAINEGKGRLIWPSHLAAFLELLERSEWITTVLSVRTPYLDLVVPEEIRERSVVYPHPGFAGVEYDAARLYFAAYGLEFPTTPLLAPEFTSPLFLKLLCEGLRAGQTKGSRALPSGMSSVFNAFLRNANRRLAKRLDFRPGSLLVHKALMAMAARMLELGQRWLAQEDAHGLASRLLPRDTYSRSLYHGMVTEGVLVEYPGDTGLDDDFVMPSYERLTDHFVASAFLEADDTRRTELIGELSAGELEALCAMCPERRGEEFVALMPVVASRRDYPSAFTRSLVWRARESVTEAAVEELERLFDEGKVERETLFETLLTVAIDPQHLMNAVYLDKRLRPLALAKRDEVWSTTLHGLWERGGVARRLVDWAHDVRPETTLPPKTVALAATALAWTLTSSNRFLRDRATAALVALLSGRLRATSDLVRAFNATNDPYVVERVYAVAYGVAMRSSDASGVAALAQEVYALVFADGEPPPHLLLRDYARGVVERALELGSAVDVDVELVRPPNNSEWPDIPTEAEIAPYRPDPSRGARDDGDAHWAFNRIGYSVLKDDFSRYVIGSNSHWLSVTLDEPLWEPPATKAELRERVMATWTDTQRSVVKAYEDAQRALVQAVDDDSLFIAEGGDGPVEVQVVSDDDVASLYEDLLRSVDETMVDACQPVEADFRALPLELHSQLAAVNMGNADAAVPHLDLDLVRRYVLRRVFELGWTTSGLGKFDTFAIGIERSQIDQKPERIGKKYQWIAYHEMIAHIADRFQCRGVDLDRRGSVFRGPWQLWRRDIDPSCVLLSTSHGDVDETWWVPTVPPWPLFGAERDWVVDDATVDPRTYLVVADRRTGLRWVNLGSVVEWKQPQPPGTRREDTPYGLVWHIADAYLLRAEDITPFMAWAKTVDFDGRWMPQPSEVHQVYLGEHGWAPSAQDLDSHFSTERAWRHPDHDCPVQVCQASSEYTREGTTLDCAIDKGYSLRLPSREMLSRLGLRWAGHDARFVDANGDVVAMDPSVDDHGPRALLVREDTLRTYLAASGMAICWAIQGEKLIVRGAGGARWTSTRLSGAYALTDGGVDGFMTSKVVGQ